MAATAAIVDYGMGNLASVLQACRHVGLEARVTADPASVAAAAGVILPGVGGFPAAMEALRRRRLVEPLQRQAAAGRPLVGICLGMQLLCDASEEHGRHPGLGLIAGDVVRFPRHDPRGARRKIPLVGWQPLYPPRPGAWRGSPLEPLEPGTYQYFDHAYHVRPRDPRTVLAESRFGALSFCAALRRGNVFGCQFHPERSGPDGLAIYARIRRLIERAAPADR
ncbi:MAG: imidazole glycerol phosphate synthase subunit HisH [Acidobacteria bacterium]|nr:MAG: imidazole glycerol phosphate synthase subunit HisH [Acidobacteriota bacterium]